MDEDLFNLAEELSLSEMLETTNNDTNENSKEPTAEDETSSPKAKRIKRKRQTPLKTEARVALRLPVALRDELEQYANRQSLSMNEVMKEALIFYLRMKAGLVDFDQVTIQRMNQLQDAVVGLSVRFDDFLDIQRLMLDKRRSRNYFEN